ncbi:hypothetical protein VTI28DRAFT_8377 [Corynascus sepedonium]
MTLCGAQSFMGAPRLLIACAGSVKACIRSDLITHSNLRDLLARWLIPKLVSVDDFQKNDPELKARHSGTPKLPSMTQTSAYITRLALILLNVFLLLCGLKPHLSLRVAIIVLSGAQANVLILLCSSSRRKGAILSFWTRDCVEFHQPLCEARITLQFVKVFAKLAIRSA